MNKSKWIIIHNKRSDMYHLNMNKWKWEDLMNCCRTQNTCCCSELRSRSNGVDGKSCLDNFKTGQNEDGLTRSSHSCRRRPVSIWVNRSDGNFVLCIWQQRLQDQAVLSGGHRPLEAETDSGQSWSLKWLHHLKMSLLPASSTTNQTKSTSLYSWGVRKWILWCEYLVMWNRLLFFPLL